LVDAEDFEVGLVLLLVVLLLVGLP
jgi:hypothetical protein